MPMSWNSIMGLVSSIALFLPVVLIIAMRLSVYKSFPALMIYYFFVFTYNLLTEGYVPASNNAVYYWGLINNLADAPLMLFFLTYFSPTPLFTKRIRISILLFILFEAVVIGLRGFNVDSITIIMAPGLLSVFSLSMYFFVRHTRIAVMYRKSTGKALITASLLFAYGCYGIIYLMYYVFKTPYKGDTFLIYFLVTTFSSLLMCAGILTEKKRVEKLEELKIARKELSIIYKDSRHGQPLRPAPFEKERFN